MSNGAWRPFAMFLWICFCIGIIFRKCQAGERAAVVLLFSGFVIAAPKMLKILAGAQLPPLEHSGRRCTSLRSSDRLAYRHYGEPTVHLFTDCPEGKLIGIAGRDAVTDQTALEGLELCAWCREKEVAAPAEQDDEST